MRWYWTLSTSFVPCTVKKNNNDKIWISLGIAIWKAPCVAWSVLCKSYDMKILMHRKCASMGYAYRILEWFLIIQLNFSFINTMEVSCTKWGRWTALQWEIVTSCYLQTIVNGSTCSERHNCSNYHSYVKWKFCWICRSCYLTMDNT